MLALFKALCCSSVLTVLLCLLMPAVVLSVPFMLVLWALLTVLFWHPRTQMALLGLMGMTGTLTLLMMVTPLPRLLLQSLVVKQAPVQADAIVVLAGGVWCEDGTLNASSLGRLVGGLQLLKAGKAPVLVVSGASDPQRPDCPSVATASRALIGALYPGQNIPILQWPQVLNTQDEAREASMLVHKRHWKRVLLVTSHSHSRRAVGLFQQQGVQVVSVPVDNPEFSLEVGKPLERFEAFKTLVYEYRGLLQHHLWP